MLSIPYYCLINKQKLSSIIPLQNKCDTMSLDDTLSPSGPPYKKEWGVDRTF